MPLELSLHSVQIKDLRQNGLKLERGESVLFSTVSSISGTNPALAADAVPRFPRLTRRFDEQPLPSRLRSITPQSMRAPRATLLS
jgi:hypothetical protein